MSNKHDGSTLSSNAEMNIDLECMQAAEKILKEIQDNKIPKSEKPINEALAVLKENGLYALIIYLESKNKEKEPMYNLLEENINYLGKKMALWPEGKVLREKAIDLANAGNIFTLFFAVDTIEQMLIYARYLVKGLPDKTVAASKDAAATGMVEP